jgi:hypothetical protein
MFNCYHIFTFVISLNYSPTGCTSGVCVDVSLIAVSFHLPVSDGWGLLIKMPHWVDVDCDDDVKNLYFVGTYVAAATRHSAS